MGFIFVLDAETGKTESDVQKLEHADAPYDVKSAGLVLRDSGMVYWAENSIGSSVPNSGNEQRIRVGALDSLNNSVTYHREIADIYGVSASLVHGSAGSAYDYLYVGASMEDAVTNRWNLAILRIDHASPTTPELAVMVYGEGGSGNCADVNNIGNGDKTRAVYIDKLGFMEDGVSDGQLFGVTRTNNHAGNEESFEAYVFRARLDSSTGAVLSASDGSSNYRVKFLVSTDLGQRSIFLGMREEMEYSSGSYYIHSIYYRIDT